MQPVSVGSVIDGRFEIVSPLDDTGGMGILFRARDRQLETDVAIKVLRLGHDPHALRRFHTEVRLARLVKHPNVCSVHEYGEDGEVVYCVEELVRGRNLRQVLAEKPLDWQRAYEIALEAAQGLQAIHEAGVVHRDFKSQNVMIDSAGHVRLVDFGIATFQAGAAPEGAPADPRLTSDRHVVGSPEYMSPEQVRGAPLDARSDIYSFGMVLHELFTGRVPFHGDTFDVMEQQVHRAPLDPAVAASLPSAVVPILERALAKSPDDRYPCVADLITDLRSAQDRLGGTESVPFPRPGPLRIALANLRRWIHLGGGRIATRRQIAALAILVVLAVIADVVLTNRRSRNEAAGTAVPASVPANQAAFAAPGRARGSPQLAPSPAAAAPGQPTASPAGSTQPMPSPSAGAPARPTPAPSAVSRRRPTPSPTPSVAALVAGSMRMPQATPQATPVTDQPTANEGSAPPQLPPAPRQAEPNIAPPTSAGAGGPTTSGSSAERPKTPPVQTTGGAASQDGLLVAGDPDVVNAECGKAQSSRYFYPPLAERLGIEGTVLVEVLIDEHGRIVESRAVNWDHALLKSMALDAVKRWRCRPATRHGVPGKMRMQIPVKFQLPKD